MYTLLIAEDEPLERQALRIIIERDFFNIKILDDAKNGVDVINKAKLFKPNIILMDIKMPEKSGLDAQREIIKFLPNVKTIITTAYEDFNFAQSSIKVGVIDYLLKPVKPYDLKNSIEKAIKLIEIYNINNSIDLNNKSNNENIINTVLAYIDNHYSESITLNTAANFVHLTPQYLSKIFKKQTGTTFVQCVTNTRLKQAKKLLVTTNKSITEVSLEVGYIDPSYFSKVFLKHEYVSPYKYKLKHHKLRDSF